MGSLSKAISILNYVFGEEGKAVTPSRAASALNINLATCSRIMSNLLKLGYLDKISRRRGYIGGPMVFSLADRPGRYNRITVNCRKALQELADDLRTTINLAVFEQGHRRILMSVPMQGGGRVPLQSTYDTAGDFYETATGRLLLSRAEQRTRLDIVARIGFPEDTWNTIDNQSDLDIALDRLRKSQEIVFYHSGFNLWIIGAIIETEELPPFAFGFGVTEDKKQEAVDGCRLTAGKIKGLLTQQEVIGF